MRRLLIGIGVVLAVLVVFLPWGSSTVAAPPDTPSTATKALKAPPTAKLIDFEVKVTPQQVRRGEVVKLTIKGSPKPGYHTYPLTQRADNPDQSVGMLPRLTYEATPGLQPLWPVTESQPEFVRDDSSGVLLEHERPFTWSQDVLILPDATPGQKALRFTIKLQVCDANRCTWGTHPFETPIEVTSAPAVMLTPELQERLQAKPPEIKVVPIAAAASPVPPPQPPPESSKAPAVPAAEVQKAPPASPPPSATAQTPLLGLLFTSMGAAIAMLFTPCVFPMIPITVSFFLKQSEKEHHNALLTAGVYSLTIIVVLALAVLVLGQFIVQLANSAGLNLGLGLVLVFFALSLFGMYEIELPHGLARYTSAHEGQGGYLGAVFMALTFTITSFTCTGPFLGPLLVAAKEFQLSMDRLILAAFAYSATFAAPFFVMALFPAMLKKLPRSGAWLNGVKVVMGFLELAAALKFLANTDLALHPGRPWFFNYETVLCAWIALSVACGLYLLGVYRLPHDTPLDHISVPRMLLASIFLGFALYMTPALWRKVPLGVIGEGLVAFLPLDTAPLAAGPQLTGNGELAWYRDYQQAWEKATQDGKPIFIDFTGVYCTNCRDNEKNVFPRTEVRDGLEKYVRVQLYTDTVPNPALSSAEAKQQAEQNDHWRTRTFDEASNPLYVIFQPGKEAPVKDGKLNGVELDRRAGTIRDLKDFINFLEHPGRKQVALDEKGE